MNIFKSYKIDVPSGEIDLEPFGMILPNSSQMGQKTSFAPPIKYKIYSLITLFN